MSDYSTVTQPENLLVTFACIQQSQYVSQLHFCHPSYLLSYFHLTPNEVIIQSPLNVCLWKSFVANKENFRASQQQQQEFVSSNLSPAGEQPTTASPQNVN